MKDPGVVVCVINFEGFVVVALALRINNFMRVQRYYVPIKTFDMDYYCFVSLILGGWALKTLERREITLSPSGRLRQREHFVNASLHPA